MTRRRGILLALIGLVVVVVGLLFLGLVLRRSVVVLSQPTPIPPRIERVVVATRDLSVRTVLSREDLRLVDVPIDLIPRGALTDPAAIVGRMTTIPLVSGEMIMGHHLAQPTNVTHDLAFVLGDDQVLMAFPATDLMSQINILRPGDLVDVLVSVQQPVEPSGLSVAGAAGSQEEDEKLFTFSALQRVEISAVVVEIIPQRGGTASGSASASARVGPVDEATPQPTPTPSPAQIEPQAILLALSPQDALVLKHLKDAGGIIDIVLRSPTANQQFELSPVMSEYLRDRYELVIAR